MKDGKKTGGFDFITQQIRESCLLNFITAVKHVLICFWEHLMYFKADVWFRNNEILLLLLLFIYQFFFKKYDFSNFICSAF